MATEEQRQELLRRGITPERARQLFQYSKPIEEVPNHFHAVLYGDGKVGKTVLTARLAKALGTKLYHISTDNGSSALQDWPSLMPYVESVRYQGPKWLQDVATAIRFDADEFEEFGVISLDTTSGVCDEYIDYVERVYNATGKQGGRDALRPKKGYEKAPVLEMASNEDYKALRQFMRPIIMDLTRSSKTVFFITHEREPFYMEVSDAKKNGEEPPKIRPDVPDKVYKALHYNCGLMGRMVKGVSGRTISFRANEGISVGSRIKELNDQKVSDNEFIEIAVKWIRERSQRD